MNKFLIIMPLYNVEKWVGLALNILKLQTHENFRCIIVNDCSTDNTEKIINFNIKDDSRFHLINNNQQNGSQLSNGLSALDFANPHEEEIIIFHDGDDWLSSTQVLEYLDSIYNSYGCWMTYGNWSRHPEFETGEHMLLDIPNQIDTDPYGYRKFPFIYTHLRTSKAFLWDKLNRKDLIDPITQNYFRSASDVAVQLPFIEMCGKSKSHRILEPLLVLNRSNPESVAVKRLKEQKDNEQYIRNLKPYSRYERK
jgi:glycosyltransferase involved in cell wall biosynthesis|tara:strand:+ start:2398 stop:3156 length:759 start_codon:yes stop_codon:yes gene_type:complete